MRNVAVRGLAGALLVLVTAAVGVSAQSGASPLVGTWKFNAQKSKMQNSLPPRSMTRVYQDRGGGVLIMQQELVDAAGWKTVSMYVAKEDGADYPLVVSGADQVPAGWIAFTRVDATTTEQTERAGNGTEARVRSKATRKLSADGRTMTLTVTPVGGGDANGPSRDADVMVFEKQ
jgi:hypothetical protein